MLKRLHTKTGSRRWRRARAAAERRRGSALISALILLSMLTMLGLSMLSSGLSGSRAVTAQADEHRLSSSVESVAALAAQDVWAGYLRTQGGAAGSIDSVRDYLDGLGLEDSPGATAPGAGAGQEWLARLGLPGQGAAREFGDVTVDGVRVFRRDEGDTTRLFVTVQATTKRGEGLVGDPLQRSVQIVYSIEPRPFEGFDYGVLANNVSCVFCHTVIDSAERYWNTDPDKFGTFNKVKVGTLETLQLRNDLRAGVTDWDADTRIAGTLYVRGNATNQNGNPITNWSAQTARPCFTSDGGQLVQDDNGDLSWGSFSPAGDPPEAGENLYLHYPTDYDEMVDGNLPTAFPPPFPDNGGIDPVTGERTSAGSGNRQCDASEFYASARDAEGTISSGTISVIAPGASVDTDGEYTQTFVTGTHASLGSSTTGNVVLRGTRDNPIVINGTVAIDGDVLIQGYIKGSGSLLVRGNIYVPTDLQYLDGQVVMEGDDPAHPTGPRTFGIAQDGTRNVLGLTCGGNMLIGDYLAPSAGGSPGPDDIVTGNPDGPWNFTLGQISLFNRSEWARTQETVPGPNSALDDPSTWIPNPTYVAGYVPRYYQFGEGDVIPIFNLGDVRFDPSTGGWVGAEVPTSWDDSILTLLDPSDTTNPLLYDPATGAARATVLQVTPSDGWLTEELQERAIEAYRAEHVAGAPVHIDGLLYTNNAIFGIVNRSDPARGSLEVNGSIVCADLGLLAPGWRAGAAVPASQRVPGSPYQVGLRVNYDKRTKDMLNVSNPFQVTMRRTLWNPTANVL